MYLLTRKRWNRDEIDIDENFAVEECRQWNNWPNWKDAIEAELTSLANHKVFEPIVHNPEGIKPIGYK